MNYLCLLGVLLLSLNNFAEAATCKQTVKRVEPYLVTICSRSWWGWCNYHHVWRYREVHRETCCAGYGGSDCQPFCSTGCNGRGTCIAPELCSCYNSNAYRGNACQTPVCTPNCKHGVCDRPNSCACYSGYTGSQCNTPICYPACQHGGTCTRPDTCSCPAGQYTGPNCDQPICNPLCLHGGTCSNSRHCQCPSNYTGMDCGTPVCNPPCQNGGRCVSPNVCSCDETYTGLQCETPLCSYHSPCFPGQCENSIYCTCNAGFTGQKGLQRCRIMTPSVSPMITRCTSIIANIDRTGQKMEKYRFVTDSSEPNSTRVDTMWVNQKDYNYINVEFAAIFTAPEILIRPEYIESFEFGIVSGKINTVLHKVDRNDPNHPFVSQNETLNCSYQPGSSNPMDVFYCNFTDENFDRVLENGDNLTLTVLAENGGFRKLKNHSSSFMDYFVGQSSIKSTMFRFDFLKPYHCLQNKSHPCSAKALDAINDITKYPIDFTFDRWVDTLAGIQEYKLQVYLLKSNGTYLREPKPWNADEEISITSTKTNFTYTPKQNGMFSFILNVIDNANNTQYARTLVLYDPLSSVTLTSMPFIATSAESETEYRWQKSLNSSITIAWKGHFQNEFHHENRLLSPVAPYLHYDFLSKYEKLVPSELDDRAGQRTLKAIPNAFGIVKFEYFFRNSNQGNSTPTSWKPVSRALSESQTFNIERRDGDTINFWIKASDILGNEKVDMTQLSFDSSPPAKLRSQNVVFQRNVKSDSYNFSSRLQVETYDRDSGIHKIHWELIANNSNVIFKSGDIPGNKTNKDYGPKLVYEIPKGDFYYYTHYLDINNCWMVVSKEKFATEFVLLKLTVYNMAMESTSYNMTITDLASLDGMNKYSGPENLTIAARYDNGVRLKWKLSPTCYERTKIIVMFISPSGKVFRFEVKQDSEWVDLTGLDPETNYNMTFVTEYGSQMSDPISKGFRTLESRSALTSGALAAIITVMLFLLSIILVGVFMWRTGRLSVAKQGIQRRMTVVRERIQNRFPYASNNLYEDQDDIYLYGQMEVNKSDSWIIPHSDVILDSLLTNGKFADIYKIRYQDTKNQSRFVAKILRSGFTAEDQMSMRAKINFYASKVGDHPNILHFSGAVLDDESLGPYMVLEFCELGQLNVWLQKQRNSINEETSEQLCRIGYGICKGMSHLENRKLVHRRLAARNVLLTSDLEPKIYGFCPQQQTAEGENKDEDGGAKEDKSRIPVKWTAPECLVTMKNASPKSDVWSFGIVLWEIFSLGEVPYPGTRSRDVQAYLRNGNRMDQPEFADNFYYILMKQCWATKPRQRPTFRDMTADIGKTFNATPSDDFYYYSSK